MTQRLAALVVAGSLAASCGGAASPPGTAVEVAPTAVADAASVPAGACVLSSPAHFVVPAAMLQYYGSAGGLTDRGEVLVVQSHAFGVSDTVSILDPTTGAVTPVVERPVAASEGAVKSQISGVAGNSDWIVWEESGLSIGQADWHKWSFDRRTGAVREIASFDAGPNGLIAPGWASDVSLSGDIAAWSAPAMIGSDRVESRIYVADLRAQTVRRLDLVANWPSLLSDREIMAATPAGADAGSGELLVQPATIWLPAANASPQTWIEPSPLVTMASSAGGTVVARITKQATATDSAVRADVVTRDAAGQVRAFSLPNGWGSVASGPGFLAWTDDQRVWILPTGRSEPILLYATPPGEIEEGATQVQLITGGSHLLWRPVGTPYDWTAVRLASVTCP